MHILNWVPLFSSKPQLQTTNKFKKINILVQFTITLDVYT